MFNFFINKSAPVGSLTASATLVDEDNVAIGGVLFICDANECCGYISSIPLINGGVRQDSTFLWLRRVGRPERATHQYGLMLGNECLASWRKER